MPVACKVEVPGEYRISPKGESLAFRCFSYEKNRVIPKNKYTKWFDYDKIEGALYLRLRKDGDRMGMVQGSKSVKQLYMEHKIEKEERGRSLLLADEAQVLWIPGVRSCDNYRIDDKTKTILEVHLSGGSENERQD
jgi:tRNA(Ile)-lysidine synthase